MSVSCAYTQGLGYDDMWLRNVVLRAEVSPPFSILYTYPDDQIYHYGGEPVLITAVTRSNWGSGSMHLTAKLRDPWGDFWDTWTTIGVDSFTMDPGMDHESAFFWYTPDNGLGTKEYDLKVELTDGGGNLVAVLSREDVFNCTHLTEEEIENLEYEVGQCWMNAQVECGVEIVGVAPYADTVADAFMFVEKACQAGELARAGRTSEAWAAGISSLISFGWVTASVVTAGASEHVKRIVHRAELVYSAGEVAHSCFNREFLSSEGITGPRGLRDGFLVDSLAVWYRTALDSTDVPIADALFVAGQCSLRVEADSSYAVMDSTGLIYADIPDLGDSMGVAIVTPEARRFESPVGTNPHSEAVFILRSRADQVLDLGLLHRTGADTLRLIRYPELAVSDSTVVVLRTSMSQEEFVLEVDRDGDGSADFEWYPGAAGLEEESIQADGATPGLTMRTIPNPTTGATTLELRAAGPIRGVTVSIYDVAGRLVRKMSLGDLGPGSHQVVWDRRDDGGRPVASGIYHCVASFDGGGRTAKRLVVLR